jgi:hypothetical protein
MDVPTMLETFAPPDKMRDLALAKLGCDPECIAELGSRPLRPGAIVRACRARHSHDGWIARRHVHAVIDYIVEGSGGDVLEEMRQSRLDALEEEAVHRDVRLMDSQFGAWLASARRAGAGGSNDAWRMAEGSLLLRAALLDLVVEYDGSFDQPDCTIDRIVDRVTGVSSSILSSMWTVSRFTRYEMADLTRMDEVLRDLDLVRDVFDRHIELTRVLAERGLELREDSTLCEEYVLEDIYDGPEWPEASEDEWPRSALEKVVCVMEEMRFFFREGTGYDKFAHAIWCIGDCASRPVASEDAKLAVVWEHLQQGRAVLDLPERLRLVAAATTEEEMSDTHRYAVECVAEYEQQQSVAYDHCHDDGYSSSEYTSSDRDWR